MISQIVTRLTVEHDWRLVFLAAAVCFLASAAAIGLLHRARAAEARRERSIWLGLVAAAAGYAIWATHFIAILAYAHNFYVGYSLSLTILSLLLAVAIAGAGFTTVACYPGRWTAALGGAIVGLGITAVHFTAIRGLDLPGHIVWSPGLVLSSVALSVVFGGLALFVAVKRDDWGHTLLATVLLTVAVVVTHFTTVAAIVLVPNSTRAVGTASLSTDSLPAVIAGAAALILGMCLIAASNDRQSRAKLRRQKILLDAALENISQGLCMYDAGGHVLLANEPYSKMMGFSAASLKGRSLLDLLYQRKAFGDFAGDPEAYLAQLITKMAEGKSSSTVLELSAGRTLRIVDHPMGGGGWVTTLEDITDWREAQVQISHMARHDALTDLPNRRLFREQLEQALRRLKRNEHVAVFCIDLDYFKDVNDSLGHSLGDDLLKQVARRLNECVRRSDTVSRLGGDEFAIVASEAHLLEATTLANRIVDVVGAPYDIQGHEIVIGTSIGISVAPDDGKDPDQLLSHADLALYRAKADGRGTYRFFETGMDARAQARRLLMLDLRTALSREEFQVYYQPIYDLESGQIICFEGLLRWNHPLRGIILPTHIIHLAEETGLIVPIGNWVLRRACADAATWSSDVSVAVNLSPAQFRSRNLVTSIIAALSDSGLAANRLELEITEAVLLQESAPTLSILHELRGLGIRISMDDFGTGYSSLSYLRSFPFDKIKIDRSFVHELAERSDSMAIVRAVTGLGKSLGIATTAEGVETSEQLELLRSEGCTQVQGFLFSVPRPASEVEKMLSEKQLRFVA